MNLFIPKPIVRNDISLVIEKWLIKSNKSDELDFKEQLQIDDDTFNLLIGETIKVFTETKDELKKVNVGDFTKIKNIAHKIKGTALSLEMGILKAASLNLENAAKDNSKDIQLYIKPVIDEIDYFISKY